MTLPPAENLIRASSFLSLFSTHSRVVMLIYVHRKVVVMGNREFQQGTRLPVGTVARDVQKLVKAGVFEYVNVGGCYHYRLTELGYGLAQLVEQIVE
jgi:DNA-binding HxlR family transcriptional regulator